MKPASRPACRLPARHWPGGASRRLLRVRLWLAGRRHFRSAFTATCATSTGRARSSATAGWGRRPISRSTNSGVATLGAGSHHPRSMTTGCAASLLGIRLVPPGNDWLLRARRLRVPIYLHSANLDVGVTCRPARCRAKYIRCFHQRLPRWRAQQKLEHRRRRIQRRSVWWFGPKPRCAYPQSDQRATVHRHPANLRGTALRLQREEPCFTQPSAKSSSARAARRFPVLTSYYPTSTRPAITGSTTRCPALACPRKKPCIVHAFGADIGVGGGD